MIFLMSVKRNMVAKNIERKEQYEKNNTDIV